MSNTKVNCSICDCKHNIGGDCTKMYIEIDIRRDYVEYYAVCKDYEPEEDEED